MKAEAHSRKLVSFAAAVLLQILPAHAQDSLALTIAATPTEQVEWTLGELDQLDQVTFTTSTIWTDGEVTFSGPALKTVVDAVGATGSSVQLTALNDYSIIIPVEELDPESPVVATRMNGKPIPVREKGPFWVVYPYDADRSFRTELIYSRSIWQLNRMKILD